MHLYKELRSKINKMAFTSSTNQGILQEQNASNKEVIFAVIEYLKDKFKVTDEELATYKDQVLERWHDEEYTAKKERLKAGESICSSCVFVGPQAVFTSSGSPKCPRCQTEDADSIFTEPSI